MRRPGISGAAGGAGLLAVAALVFFLVTSPANHTEAEDAYFYARAVEQAPWASLPHPHHALYLPLMRGLYRAANGLGLVERSFPVLALFSALCAAAAVGLFALLAERRLGLSRPIAWLAAGSLAASYGFWRYAVEAELYAPAILVSLWALYAASNPKLTPARAGMAGLLSGLAALVHIMNALVTLVAVPVLLVQRRQWRSLVLHTAVAAAVFCLAFAAIGWGPRDLAQGGDGGTTSSLLAPVQGMFAFGQNLVSANFLFAFEGFREWAGRAYRGRMLEEEFFMGRHVPTATRLLTPVALSALVFVVFLGVRCRMRRATAGPPSSVDARMVAAAGAWWLSYAIILLRFEPGNPELWIMALPPFWLVMAGWVFAPVAARGGRDFLAAGLVALVATNWLGGMLPLRHPEGDYNVCKAKGALSVAQPEDVILTAGGPVFLRYLRYHAPARVESLTEWPLDQLEECYQAAMTGPGQMYVLGDVLGPPVVYMQSHPVRMRKLATVAQWVARDFELAWSDEFGGGYRRRAGAFDPRGADGYAVPDEQRDHP